MKLLEQLQQWGSWTRDDPYIIAEAGVNHEGSLDTAFRLIDEAKEGGAHAIKFQTYKAEYLASKDSPAYWDKSQEPTESQFELFKKYDKFWKAEYEELKKRCDKVGIEFLSTPFDVHSAEFLNELMPAFKISSSDIDNIPFIEYLVAYGKPVLLSTGASYLWEIERAMEVLRDRVPVCLMHCILNYPTENENANLGMLFDQIRRFPDAVPGYSDHTLPGDMEVLRMVSLMGAVVIEKHFTHDKTLPGNDHYHAMDKEDLKVFWERWKGSKELLGEFEKRPLSSEQVSRENARRSLVAAREIRAGKTFEEADLTWKRPAKGISPAHYREIIGKEATRDIQQDEVLTWSMVG